MQEQSVGGTVRERTYHVLEQFTEKRNDWSAVFLREKGQKAYTKKG